MSWLAFIARGRSAFAAVSLIFCLFSSPSQAGKNVHHGAGAARPQPRASACSVAITTRQVVEPLVRSRQFQELSNLAAIQGTRRIRATIVELEAGGRRYVDMGYGPYVIGAVYFATYHRLLMDYESPVPKFAWTGELEFEDGVLVKAVNMSRGLEGLGILNEPELLSLLLARSDSPFTKSDHFKVYKNDQPLDPAAAEIALSEETDFDKLVPKALYVTARRLEVVNLAFSRGDFQAGQNTMQAIAKNIQMKTVVTWARRAKEDGFIYDLGRENGLETILETALNRPAELTDKEISYLQDTIQRIAQGVNTSLQSENNVDELFPMIYVFCADGTMTDCSRLRPSRSPE